MCPTPALAAACIKELWIFAANKALGPSNSCPCYFFIVFCFTTEQREKILDHFRTLLSSE